MSRTSATRRRAKPAPGKPPIRDDAQSPAARDIASLVSSIPLADTTALYESIRKDPSDLAPYLVLADLLLAHGDPRGELISIQHVRELGDTRNLKIAEARLFAKHREILLGKALVKALDAFGELYRSEEATLEWRLGFLRRACIRIGGHGKQIVALVKSLLRAPSAIVLESLELQLDFQPQVKMEELVDLLATNCPPSLRELRFASAECNLRSLHKVWPRVPALRALRIGQWGGIDLGAFDLPNLEDLELIGPEQQSIRTIFEKTPPRLRRLYLDVYSRVPLELVTPLLQGAMPSLRDVGIYGNDAEVDVDRIELGGIHSLALGPVTSQTLATILNGSCTQLQRLQLHFARHVRRDEVRPILDGALPNLRELSLGQVDHSFAIDLLDAPILRQLEVLDLVDLTTRDLAQLAERADRLAHLKQLRFVTPPMFSEAREKKHLKKLQATIAGTVVHVEKRVVRSVRNFGELCD